MAAHKASGSCGANYEGPAGDMEKVMALRMWQWSEDTTAMCYTTMISNGESTYKALLETHPYADISVKK